jgi:hypothetical protein
MNYLELLRDQFNQHFDYRIRRPGVTQLILPLYYEDGDMIDIFLESLSTDGQRVRICDHGMALMRLSYGYELNTPRKEEILQRILSENLVSEDNGNLFMDVEPAVLYPSVLQFAQALAKVTSMRFFRREIIQNLFPEMLDEFVSAELRRFNPVKPLYPIPEHEEYEVDYCFNHHLRPIYLFGVNSQSQARLATVSCQKFMLESIRFRSLIVLESLDILGKKDQARLMAVADKEFPSLDTFQENAVRYFERELS